MSNWRIDYFMGAEELEIPLHRKVEKFVKNMRKN